MGVLYLGAVFRGMDKNNICGGSSGVLLKWIAEVSSKLEMGELFIRILLNNSMH